MTWAQAIPLLVLLWFGDTMLVGILALMIAPRRLVWRRPSRSPDLTRSS